MWRKLCFLLRNPSVKQIIRVDAKIYDFKDDSNFKKRLEAMSKVIFDREEYETAHVDQTAEQRVEVINKIHDRVVAIKSVNEQVDASYAGIQPGPKQQMGQDSDMK